MKLDPFAPARLWPKAISGLIALASPEVAQAQAGPSKEQCLTAYDRAQAFRAEGRFRAWREQLLLCVQPSCPAVVNTDCAQWLTEADSSTPTIVLEVLDTAGKDATNVRVLVDGEMLQSKLDGKAVLVDPGEHIFRFELPGSAPKEEHVVIREGEKNRRISMSFQVAAPATAQPAPGPEGKMSGQELGTLQGPEGGDAVESHSGGVPPIAYALSGLGVASIAVGTVFNFVAKSEIDEAEVGCGKTRTCTAAQVDSIKSKQTLGILSLGVGIVSLGVATVLIITAPSPTAAKAVSRVPVLPLEITPTNMGAFATFKSVF